MIRVEGEKGLLPTRDLVTAIVSVSKAFGVRPTIDNTLTYFAVTFFGEATTNTIVFVDLLETLLFLSARAKTCQLILTSVRGIGINSSETYTMAEVSSLSVR